MCGILAIQNKTALVNKSTLQKGLAAIQHRGPDEQGFWFSANKKIALGHQRLTIIDQATGQQPLTSADGRIAAIVNGEFYDYKKIKAELKKKGYRFKTKTDSEIIINLYLEYGLKFVNHLRGEFAFVFFDAKKNLLIAGRDRFGIKPLVYHQDKAGNLKIASEAKAIFATGLEPELDDYTLFHSFTFQYPPQDRTFFKGVSQLKPGHLLISNGKTIKLLKYWDLNLPKENSSSILPANEKTIAKKLETLLLDSVKQRLQTEKVKYCCHVSGGVDSSLIAALTAKIAKDKIHCFTLSFPEAAYDETKLARKLAKHIGANFTNIKVGADEVIKNFSDSIYYSEGTAINYHLTAKYLLNKKIKESGYTIALSGEGSDEALAGYAHLRKEISTDFNATLNDSDSIVAGVHFATGQALALSLIKNKLGYIPSFLEGKASIGFKLHSLLNPKFKKRFSVAQIQKDLLSSLDIKDQLQSRSRLSQSTYLWVKLTLANYILKTLGDGCEMAHAVEGRVPFLDHPFFDFTKTIPLSLKIKGSIQKYILRKVAAKYIPKEIYDRPKQTFMAPPLSLLKNQKGLAFIRQHFQSSVFRQMGYFNQKKALALIQDLNLKPVKDQIAIEPVVMLMLSTFFLYKNFIVKKVK